MRWLAPGSPTKARVWLARPADGMEIVVKDFGHLPAGLRWWGRLQVLREMRALRLISDLPCVPQLVGRVDRDAFATTVVPGVPFDELASWAATEPAVSGLVDALERVHALGVVHLDLRSRDNIRVDRSGAVYLVDWASALHLRPGTLRHRVLFHALAQVDRSAVVKWKGATAPGRLSIEEREFARRWRAWRRLWPVNRKGLRRGPRNANGPSGERVSERSTPRAF